MRVVTGEAKGRKLKTPKTSGTRPIMDRVKTALFDILSTQVEDARFLDLFAGTGSVGIEALSRGAQHATFIEMNPKILKLVRENLQITQLAHRAETLHSDAFKFLQAHQVLQTSQNHVSALSSVIDQRRIYNIIYVAPPQYEELAARALVLIDSRDQMIVQIEILPLGHLRDGAAANLVDGLVAALIHPVRESVAEIVDDAESIVHRGRAHLNRARAE